MIIRFCKKISLSLLLLLAGSGPAWGLSSGYDFLSMRPATDGGGYFSLWDTQSLPKKHFVVGNQMHYAYKPLQIMQSGSRLRGVVDHALLQEFYASYGIIERWLAVGVTIPVAWYLNFLDPNVVSPSEDGKTALGDIRINFKSQLMDREQHGWGLAVVPFITIPTGSGDHFLGSKSVTGGGLFAVELEPLNKWSLVANVGVEAVPDFNLRNANKNVQLLAGIGSKVQLSPPLEGVVELVTSGRASGFYQEKVESPVELRGGMKYHIPKTGFTANLGGGSGIINGSGAPLFRVFAGLSYSSHKQKTANRENALDYINHQAVLFFDVNKRIDGPEADKVLKKITKHINRGQLKEIRIKGYADKTGSALYNLQLSQDRAKQTKEFLKSLPEGFKVNTQGYGYRFYRNQSPDNRCALNERCVLFEVVK